MVLYELVHKFVQSHNWVCFGGPGVSDSTGGAAIMTSVHYHIVLCILETA